MTHIHTKAMGLAAMEALGYTAEDRVISMLISTDQISVRRLARRDEGNGAFTIVEDCTILNPRNMQSQEHPVPTGPLNTSPDAGQGG